MLAYFPVQITIVSIAVRIYRDSRISKYLLTLTSKLGASQSLTHDIVRLPTSTFQHRHLAIEFQARQCVLYQPGYWANLIWAKVTALA